jgi:hypothetical protein
MIIILICDFFVLPHDGHKGQKKYLSTWEATLSRAKNMEDFGSKFSASTSLHKRNP